ncbi:MAG: DUF2808 domain-containing protein [Microcoleus sp. PH2017_10_PVI_O_A]|uniref:DUF2808 domain-containing protein n=1 Tax=unclassified Microcoleus TaxID=2642155 RepID=UPI001D73532B|nr:MULTISPECIES: DUF2808 domain-containing protein [unclassified Microcoleus]TAE83493.1 MAG: DUF2808 domain-containing protein [Oscillatoriales cyanobacterium]MCC3404479.1 DUF2808 domain-containing protein [Microcoleus sp. PH2017_10_PVI_O_A]MCC3458547.1 DUF2808 domain-containing protein [Microcoleus sp. PH2017_11_PCY_U_A]MCC3476797.1 DUF2808 domain-containing protein [Microcoleus sp. PH2017_12_PCY_D_A]MCC3526936.1 DUF2808 domain-containing protein [Microcoleus sp. PH2017_21_RUC_O_A]
MKKLIYAAAFTLILASNAPATIAGGAMQKANVPHLLGSAATPNRAGFQGATHRFDIQVEGRALSEIAIALPDALSIRGGIEVKNQSNQKIETQVSLNNQKATVVFAQPVAPDTTISIYMRGIQTRGYRYNWAYAISGKMVGINAEIPLGRVGIQTY